MKLADNALLAIMEALRRGLTEMVDVSDLLKQLDLEPDANGKLALTKDLKDVWE